MIGTRRSFAARGPSGWFVLATAALMAACGGGEASGGDPPGEAPADTAGAPPSPGAEAGASLARLDSPPAAAPRMQECAPAPATSASAGWTRFEGADGAFSFAHPSDWETLDPIQVTGAFDAATYAEAGLASDTRTPLQVVRDPSGLPNVVVYRLPGVRSSVDTLYARHDARFRSLPQLVRVVRAGLSTCLAGERARGMDFVFRQDVVDLATGEQSEGQQEAFQRSWFAVRDGVLHHVQFLAADSTALPVLDEVLRTWTWGGGSRAAAILDAARAAAPDAAAGGGAPGDTDGMGDAGAAAARGGSGADVAEAAMAAGVDTSREGPDPASYTTSFAHDAPGIYVVFRLTEGEGGRVVATWRKDGVVVREQDQTVPGGRWAFMAITPAPGGFIPGAYELTLRVDGTDNSRVLPFTVEAPSVP
ncbi:MAG TPA: hypothetical protein VIC56_02135 [Gemmatimonadota bacterium]|jgi:hypothetical protein